MTEKKYKHKNAYYFRVSKSFVIDISEATDCVGDTEIYCNFYKCSNCNNNQVRLYDVYCSTCGCKFNWKE